MEDIYSNPKLLQTGVYAIVNLQNSKTYIGSTAKSFKNRLKVHLHQLSKGMHHSKSLQKDWKGNEENFAFLILEIVDVKELSSLEDLTDLEQQWLIASQSDYNSDKVVRKTSIGYKQRESIPYIQPVIKKERVGAYKKIRTTGRSVFF